MAKAREIKNRIKSVSNTQKITRTMEMVATARAMKVRSRVEEIQPYNQKMAEVAAGIMSGEEEESGVDHPLLQKPETVERVTVLLLSSNRGLCGAFNSNLFRHLLSTLETLRNDDVEIDLYVVGRKGERYMDFVGEPVDWSRSDFDYLPDYDKVEELANDLMARFEKGTADRVLVVYSKYFSAADQRPTTGQLLPISTEELTGREDEDEEDVEEAPEEEGRRIPFEYVPDAESILSNILPLSVRMKLYSMFLETSASEQIARRIAMKNATDNADEMIGELRRYYNRARQAQITSEIADIIGGAQAMQ